MRAQALALGVERDRLVEGALALDLGVSVSGFYEAGDVERRLPGNAHLRVPGCDGDSMLYLLDAAGVECSISVSYSTMCLLPPGTTP